MRSGSQGVKNKNIKLINGRSLMYYTIKQAIKSRIFDHIVVSTDSKKILRIAKSYGADGWFLRPKKLSLNSSQKVPVIRHALLQAEKFYNKKFETIIDLDATSPLRKTSDILKAYKFFVKQKANILFSGCKSKKNPYFNMIEIVNNKIDARFILNVKVSNLPVFCFFPVPTSRIIIKIILKALGRVFFILR